MGGPSNVSADSETADSPTELLRSSEEVKQKPRKWYYYVWDTLDKPKEERWFMFKLDAALLTFASLGMNVRDVLDNCTYSLAVGYFIKYLDQSNINSAFVSGM